MFRNQPATSILSNNTNELIGRRQQGGVMLEVKGELAKYATSTGADPTGLERWNYIDVVNRENKVRIISAYQCMRSKPSLGTVYIQWRQYFLARNINICPRKLFIMHLEEFITESIASGLEAILIVDANEHVVKGKLSRQLRNLGLVEAYCNKFESTGGTSSYIRGKHQLDGVWYTRNIVPTSVTICPFHFDVGDHRAYVVDFQMNIILGELSTLFFSPNKRHLTCSFPIIVQRYLERAEAQFHLHKISFKIQQSKEQWHTLVPLMREVWLNRIDELETDLIINTEKKCRKFRSGEVLYSLEIAKAGKTWYFWKLLLKHKLNERNSFTKLLTLSV